MGISIGSNFDLGTTLPLDSREVVADLAARDAILAGVRYEGLTVYVVSEAASFQLVGGVTNAEWVDASGGGFETTDYAISGYSNRFNETFSSTDLLDTLNKILNIGYVAPTVNLTAAGSGTLREKGDSVASVLLTAAVTQLLDPIARIQFFRDGLSIDDNNPPGNTGSGNTTYTDITPFSDNVTFRVDVTDDGASGGPTTVQSSRTFNFVYPYYSGVGAVGLTAAAVAALTKDIRTENTNLNQNFGAATAQVYYFAYPAAYGTLSSILDTNGFETFGDWTLRVENITGLDATSQSYNIYEFNNVVTAGATDYTFAQ